MAPSNAYVSLIDPTGLLSNAYPCFQRSTLVDQLNTMSLTWKYYTVGVQSIWNAPNSIQQICGPVVSGKCTGAGWKNVVNNPSLVLTDIQNYKLANVAWVTPTAANSDHPVTTTTGGPAWVASIVNSIGNSACGYWQNTAILITWDDWGGYFDHVPPPSIGQPNGWGTSYVYGFRVPLLVVSAYTL